MINTSSAPAAAPLQALKVGCLMSRNPHRVMVFKPLKQGKQGATLKFMRH